jgi:hypothetical protein
MPLPTLARDEYVAQIRSRALALTPASTRHWGKMSPHGMICHLTDSFFLALGERSSSDVSNLLSRTVMKYFALQVALPWPKGVPTGPEVQQGAGGTPPGDFEQDRQRLLDVIERFRVSKFQDAAHPFFGPLSPSEWLRWGYLHADHHLRQFGV